MNFRPMVHVDNAWVGNALVFATKEEAEANVRQLAWNWTAVRDTRVDETAEPVNYRFENGKLQRLEDVSKKTRKFTQDLLLEVE